MLFVGILCLLATPFALASLTNVTIDDKFGDPHTSTHITYFPVNAWNNGTQPCWGCTAQPDPSQLYNTTWHGSTFDSQRENTSDSSQIPSASVTFNGSALYVYCAIPYSSSSPEGNLDLTFFIDGELVGTLTQVPITGSQPDYQYHVPVYVNLSMPAAFHIFTLLNGHEGGQKSIILLDSIVYTHDDEASSAPSSVPATHFHRTVLLGSILGTLLGLLSIGFGSYLYLKFRRRRRRFAPSQQYAANELISKWFDDGRASANLPPCVARNILDPQSSVATVQSLTPPGMTHSNSEGFRTLMLGSHFPGTRSDTALTLSVNCLSTMQREPPLVPGRRYLRVVNQ